jgi:hypothetical protein
VEQIAAWRGLYTGPKSVLIQFSRTFTATNNYQRVTVRTGVARTASLATKTAIASTLRDTAAQTNTIQLPKVWAALPGDWMARSWIAGPQVTKAENPTGGTYAAYEGYFLSNFLTARNYPLTGANFEPWLYDRAATVYKAYFRTGHENSPTSAGFMYLQEAYRSSDLYRVNVDANGCFIPKNGDEMCDQKYSYAECMAYAYLMTGDTRYTDVITRVKGMQDNNGGRTGHPYAPGTSWTERDHGVTWSAYVFSFLATGNTADSTKAATFMNSIINLQNAPYPQNIAADGCWRHNSSDYGEGGDVWGCSPWMSVWMLDIMFQWYLITGDNRVIPAFQKFAAFIYRSGIAPDPPLHMYYYASSIAGSWADGGEESHNMEAAFEFAMGWWANGRTNPSGINYPPRVTLHFNDITGRAATVPPRMFNWVFRTSSWLLWFMDANKALPGDLLTVENEKAVKDGRPSAGSLQIAPNPFNPSMAIGYEVSRTGRTTLADDNTKGALISTLADRQMGPGSYTAQWNASGQASGIYIAKLISGNQTVTKQVMLLK